MKIDGRQVAIFNVPVTRNPIPVGTLRDGLLRPNGIRHEEHLLDLLRAPDPRAAFLKVLPADGPRYNF